MHHQRLTTTSAAGRRFRLAAVLAAGAGLTLSACGSSSARSPASAVDTSVSQLGGSSSVVMRVSLGVSPQQAEALLGHAGTTPGPAARALSSGYVFLTAQTGHGEPLDSSQAVTDSRSAYDFGLKIGSTRPFEIRYVDQNLFAHLDAAQLLQDVGRDPAQAASLQKELSSLDTYVPGLSDLGAGKWVEVTSSSLAGVGSLLEQVTGGSAATQVQQLVTGLRTAAVSSLKANTTLTGPTSRDGRSQYRATVDLHGFLAAFDQAAQKDLATVPMVGPQISSGLGRLEDRVPAGRTATATVYTSGGKLSELDVDLNQFATAHPMSFPVPLQVRFSGPAPAVESPQGATQLDLSKLPSLLALLVTGHNLHPGSTTQASGAAQ